MENDIFKYQEIDGEHVYQEKLEVVLRASKTNITHHHVFDVFVDDCHMGYVYDAFWWVRGWSEENIDFPYTDSEHPDAYNTEEAVKANIEDILNAPWVSEEYDTKIADHIRKRVFEFRKDRTNEKYRKNKYNTTHQY